MKIKKERFQAVLVLITSFILVLYGVIVLMGAKNYGALEIVFFGVVPIVLGIVSVVSLFKETSRTSVIWYWAQSIILGVLAAFVAITENPFYSEVSFSFPLLTYVFPIAIFLGFIVAADENTALKEKQKEKTEE